MPDVFSPQQARLVLARVAELQALSEDGASLTREDLGRAVTDAGLEEAHLEQALRELEASRIRVATETKRNVTAATSEVRHWLTQAELHEVVCRLGHVYGGDGQITRSPSAWWWVRRGPHQVVSLAVRYVSTGTLLRLEVRDREVQLGRPFMIGLAAALAASIAFHFTPISGVAAILGSFLAFMGAAWFDLDARRRGSRRDRLDRARTVLTGALRRLPLPNP